MHIRCPHCTNPIELVEAPRSGEVSCPSCGSSFHLEQDTTLQMPVGGVRQLLGKFELLEVVGRGAFGAVYRAKDLTLDRVVAIKVPRSGNLPEGDQRERFLREARSVAQLRHPAIVPIHEVGEADGLPYLVSDFIQGVTLADQLSAGRPQPREAARLLAELADAIHYAHDQKIIHRDLKPSNIMIDRAGRPYVMDFGLAKRDAGEITMTVEGQILGTPAYMSPEQASGEAARVDGRCDVYSMGVIFYHLLTGEVPFRGTVRMLLVQVALDEPQPPRALNEQVPRDLETICLKAMAKEPAKRYQSAADLASDLRRFLDGKPILARPVSRVEKTWRWCKRNPALASASGLAAAGLFVTAIVSTWFGVYQHQAAEEIRAEEKKTAAALVESRKQSALLALDNGLALCGKGEVGPGMLWLVRALEIMPSEAKDLERVLRINLGDWRGELAPLQNILPHPQAVTVMALSSDGTLLATGSLDKQLRLWETASGKLHCPPLPCGDWLESLAFSPDGQWVAGGDGAGGIHLLKAASGARLHHLEHGTVLDALSFSPDSKWLATASTDNQARLWDVATGKAVGMPMNMGGRSMCLAFRPDGKILATTTNPGSAVARLFEAGTGKEAGVLTHKGAVEYVAFSKDGKYCLSVGSNPGGQLWDGQTFKSLNVIITHQDKVTKAAFSPDGKIIGTGSLDQTARLWHTATGQPIGLPMPHPGGVSALSFSNDGAKLMTGSYGGQAQLWDAATARALIGRLQHEGQITGALISRDGATLITGGGDGHVKLWQASTPPRAGFTLEANGSVEGLLFSPDSKLLAACDFGRSAHLWDAVSGKRIGQAMVEPHKILDIAFDIESRKLLTACQNGNAQLWDATSAQRLGESTAHQGAVNYVLFHPDGKRFLTVASDEKLKGYRGQAWDIATRNKAGTEFALPQTTYVYSMALSANGQTVAFGFESAERGGARLFDVDSGKLLPVLAHEGGVVAASFSPNGRLLCTASTDKTAALWDVASGQRQFSLPHRASVQCCQFGHTGSVVATGAVDRIARLWNTSTGAQTGLFLHGDVVFSLAFSPDDQMLLTGCGDGVARLWDVPTGKLLGRPRAEQGMIKRIAFSPNGAQVASGGSAKVELWPVPQAWTDDVNTIKNWIQRTSGLAMEPANNSVTALDAPVWQSLPDR